MGHLVKEVITNAADFEGSCCEDAAATPQAWAGNFAGGATAAAAAESSQRLVIQPRHQGAQHDCPLCPTNLCKVRLDPFQTGGTSTTVKNSCSVVFSTFSFNIDNQNTGRSVLSGAPDCVQGLELCTLRRQHGYRRIIYLGDGANDLCPALALGRSDVVLARKGYDLDLLIRKRAAGQGGATVQAAVHTWETHQQLFSLVRRLAA